MRPPRWRRPAAGALALLAATLSAGCARNVTQSTVDEGAVPQDFLEPVGRYAIQTDELWNLVLWIAIAIFVLVQGILVVSIIRYRERRGDDRLPKQVHGNPRLEAIWTVIPALLLAGVAVPTVRTLFDLAQEPEGALTIDVTGHQWWWEFRYEGFEGLATANIARIPTGEIVHFRLHSADVIHSFWIPKLAGKQDTVPGRTGIIKVQVDQPGEYLGQCAEFCGLSHANMRLRVVAMRPAEFRRWAEANAQPQRLALPAGSPELRGKALFATKACVGCHSIRGYQLSRDEPGVEAALRDLGHDAEAIAGLFQRGPVRATATVGPDLTYFSDRGWFAGAIFTNTDENLRRWLENPPAMKPMQPGDVAGMPDLGLNRDEIDALVAFLRTLRTD